MQDSDLEYLIWQFDKRIILSEKKPPLGVPQKISPCLMFLLKRSDDFCEPTCTSEYDENDCSLTH